MVGSRLTDGLTDGVKEERERGDFMIWGDRGEEWGRRIVG